MGDEDQRQALAGHFLQRREQSLGLDIGQHRGWLVEDQDAGVVIERLEDLDALLLADRQVAKTRARIDLEAEALSNCQKLLARC